MRLDFFIEKASVTYLLCFLSSGYFFRTWTLFYGFSFPVTDVSRILSKILCVIHSILLYTEVLL